LALFRPVAAPPAGLGLLASRRPEGVARARTGAAVEDATGAFVAGGVTAGDGTDGGVTAGNGTAGEVTAGEVSTGEDAAGKVTAGDAPARCSTRGGAAWARDGTTAGDAGASCKPAGAAGRPNWTSSCTAAFRLLFVFFVDLLLAGMKTSGSAPLARHTPEHTSPEHTLARTAPDRNSGT